jgi:hypothetical protein
LHCRRRLIQRHRRRGHAGGVYTLGYPAWWNFVTAALEMLSAALIVLPEARIS